MERYPNIMEALKACEEKHFFLFDMDGLLFDTERLFMEQLAIVMKEHGYILTKEIYQQSLGLAGQPLKRLMLEHYGEDYPFEEMGRISRDRVSMVADTVGLCLKPEISQVLEYLRDKGHVCGVASSTDSKYVEQYLKKAGIADYFQEIVGGEMVTHSKPEPEIFLKCMKLCGGSPELSVVLEDSENGVRAGKAAGMTTICIPDLKWPGKDVEDSIDYLVG